MPKDILVLFEEIVILSLFYDSPKYLKFDGLKAEVKWVEFFSNDKSPYLEKICEYTFSFPHSNTSSVRNFTLMRISWKMERNRIDLRTLDDELMVKQIYNMSCQEFYKYLNNDEVYYVGTTNNAHHEVVMMLLNLGKNVLCEKPLGMNVKETQDMIAAAQKNKAFFMEGMWARFFPVQVKLREELKKKTLGDVKLVTVTFGMAVDKDKMQRVLKPELGGGCMMDMGVYTIAISQMVFGEMPKSVTAVGYLNEYGVDVLDSVTMLYSGERMATFQVTCMSEVPNEAIICGTKGTIKIHKPFWCSNSMEILDKKHEFPFPKPVAKSYYDNGVGFLYEANEVKNCIRKGLKECPIVTHQDTLTFATLIEKCRKMIGVKYNQDQQ